MKINLDHFMQEYQMCKSLIFLNLNTREFKVKFKERVLSRINRKMTFYVKSSIINKILLKKKEKNFESSEKL